MKLFISKIYVSIFRFLPYELNHFLAKLFKKFHNLHIDSSYQNDFLCHLSILNIKFKLWLLGKDAQAQSVYRKLHKTNSIYEYQLIRILNDIIETNRFKTFLDIGAFMGYFACFIGKKNNDLQVHAIESNSNYSEFIKRSLNENKLENVKVHNEILSNNEKKMFFHKEGVYSENKLNQFQNKTSTTLDNLCKKNRINPEVIKIDVHGAEGLVLRGSISILKNNCKIILLELHSDEYLNKFSQGDTRASIIKILLENDYSCLLVSSFRDDNIQNKKISNKPIKKINIDTNNLDQILFDRNKSDQLIIAHHKEIDLKEFNCFNK